MNKRGSVTIYLVFIITAILVVLAASVFAPMGVLFNTELYKAGEDIMLMANESIAGINNSDIKAQYYTNMEASLGSIDSNIELSHNLFQYGWVFVILLVAVVLFLFTRRIVEYSGGGIF